MYSTGANMYELYFKPRLEAAGHDFPFRFHLLNGTRFQSRKINSEYHRIRQILYLLSTTSDPNILDTTKCRKQHGKFPAPKALKPT
jgi:hypothetical protein